MGEKVLASNLYVHCGVNDWDQSEKFIAHKLRESARSIPESLLIHDKIIIPVTDYQNCVVLASVIGPSRLRVLLEAGVIGFCRFTRLSGFHPFRRDITNAGEFVQFGVSEGQNHLNNMNIEEISDFASKQILLRTGEKIAPDLIKNHSIQVDQISLANDFNRTVENSIKNNPVLYKWISEAVDSHQYLRKIPPAGQPEKTIFVLNQNEESYRNSPWMRALMIYHAQMDLHLQQIIDARDLRTSFSDKIPFMASQGSSNVVSNAFDSVAELLSIPSFDNFDWESNEFDKLMQLRQSKGSEHFRNWVGQVGVDSDGDQSKVGQELINELLSNSVFDSQPMKLLRCLITSIPVLGQAAPLVSLIDDFALDKMFSKKPVRLFVEKMRSRL